MKYQAIQQAIKEIDKSRDFEKRELLIKFYMDNRDNMSLYEADILHDDLYYELEMQYLEDVLNDKEEYSYIFKDNKQLLDVIDLSSIEVKFQEWDFYRNYYKVDINIDLDHSDLDKLLATRHISDSVANLLVALESKKWYLDLSDDSASSIYDNANGYVSDISEDMLELVHQDLECIRENIESVIKDKISDRFYGIGDYYMSDNYIYDQLFEACYLDNEEILELFKNHSYRLEEKLEELEIKFNAI